MRWSLILLGALGCATGGDGPGGGGLNLPANEYYGAVLPEEPEVLDVEGGTASRPWGLPLGDGRIQVWFGVVTGATVAVHTTIGAPGDDGWSFDPPTSVLPGADHPSVIRRDGGLVMAYVQDGAVGIATSGDGATWDRTDDVLGATESWEGDALAWPSLVDDPASGSTLLFYAAADGTGVGVAAAPLGATTFTRLSPGPVFAPAAPAEAVEGEDPPDPVWDESPLSGVSVTGEHTAIGRRSYAMYYSSSARGGYAAAFDPTQWSRSSLNPVLIPETTGTALAEPMRAGPLLLHTRRALADSDRRALAIAIFGYAPPEAEETTE